MILFIRSYIYFTPCSVSTRYCLLRFSWSSDSNLISLYAIVVGWIVLLKTMWRRGFSKKKQHLVWYLRIRFKWTGFDIAVGTCEGKIDGGRVFTLHNLKLFNYSLNLSKRYISFPSFHVTDFSYQFSGCSSIFLWSVSGISLSFVEIF